MQVYTQIVRPQSGMGMTWDSLSYHSHRQTLTCWKATFDYHTHIEQSIIMTQSYKTVGTKSVCWGSRTYDRLADGASWG